MNFSIDDSLKSVQIAFYIVGGIVAVLTYLSARKGLLNPVNTEYQKRVIDRLHKLSDDLFSEFDPKSETYWAKKKPVHDAIKTINETFERHKQDILKSREYPFGIPVTDDWQRLTYLLKPFVSDPFIPDNIRQAVLDLLENRISVLFEAYCDAFEEYSLRLAKGVHPPYTTIDEINRLHNQIVDRVREMGCGITAIEDEIHEIRRLIQDYFDSFNPHRSWWETKRKKFQPTDNHPYSDSDSED